MKARKHLNIRLPHLRIPLWWPDLPSSWRTWLPSRGNVLFTLIVVSGLLWASGAGALPMRAPVAATTSTGTIAYQGRLADADGNPLTGTYSMVFRLYDVASGGTPLWMEQWTGSNGVKVSDGLFNVMLGSLTPIPLDVVTGHDTLWLGITVGTDNEMEPRVQLGSVPFAVQALTVPDGSVTTAKIADGAVTQAKLGADVSLEPPDGSITTTKLADGAVTSAKLAKTDGHIALIPDANKLVKIATLRQDDVTNNYKNNQVALTGWGFVRADGANMFASEIVNFGVTFTDKPVVLATIVGQKDNSDPVDIDDVEPGTGDFVDLGIVAHRSGNTSFKVTVFDTNRQVFPSNRRILYSWIAIGTLD